MRRGKIRKFGRESIQRAALMKSLATALIEHGKIKTTSAKAKALSTFVDKMITKSTSGDIASKRYLAKILGTKAVTKLSKEISPRFKDVKGGYTRIIRLGQRKSDSAQMSIIEFTG